MSDGNVLKVSIPVEEALQLAKALQSLQPLRHMEGDVGLLSAGVKNKRIRGRNIVVEMELLRGSVRGYSVMIKSRA